MKRYSVSVYVLSIIIHLVFISAFTSCVNSGKNTNSLSVKTENTKKQEKTAIAGEYIVTAKDNCDEFMLRKFFYEYGIKEITSIRSNVFLIKFVNDPGYKELVKESEKTNSIEDIKPHYKSNL